MRCSELMKRNVVTCLPASIVSAAAELMRDRNVGFLPVCDGKRAAVGALTDRDIVVRLLARAVTSPSARVGDIMTGDAVCCSPDDDLSVAGDLMINFQISRVVCADSQRRVVGVISLSDIAGSEAIRGGTIATLIASREAAPPAHNGARRNVVCSDVMRRDVMVCHFEDPVSAVAAAMRDNNLGFIPVCDGNGSVAGTITDRDLALRVVAERRDPAKTRAGDVLTREVVFCSQNDRLEIAEALMIQHRKSRILCTDVRGRPLGVISLSDIASIEPFPIVSRVLGGVSSRV
jgi:CBS domain-containing protein